MSTIYNYSVSEDRECDGGNSEGTEDFISKLYIVDLRRS